MSRRDSVLFIVLCAVWGFSFVAIKFALRDFEPIWLAALRLWIASPLMLAWAAWRGRPLLPRGGWGEVAILGVVNAGLLHMFLILGLHFVAAGLGSILLYTYPIIAALLAVPFLSERLTATKSWGLALGFLGIVGIAGLSGGAWQGEVALLFASLSWAVGTLIFKRIVGSHDVLTLAAWSGIFGAGAVTLIAIAIEGAPSGRTAFDLFWGLGYMAIPGMAIAWVIWYYLLERGEAGVASAFLFMTPVFALPFGWLVLGERITSVKVAGVALVAAGIYLVNRSDEPSDAKSQPSARSRSRAQELMQ